MKNLKIIFTIICLTGAFPLAAQDHYWQQKVEYDMDINMDVEKHQYEGKQTLTYYNNSPDTISKVFFHLYYNAFQPGSMMDVRSRTIKDPDRRVGDRIYQLREDEIGYHRIQTLKQNNKDISFYVEGTILEARLNEPMLPNSKTTLQMEWNSQIPLQIRRTGRNSEEGIDYTMTQWYPKLSEYDFMGWHPNPYIGREFHGVWGDFNVKLTIDEDYTVGGTGYLQNPKEIGHGYADNAKPKAKNGKLTWHFKAPEVHDFAWGADPDYTHTMKQVPGGPMLHFFYQKNDRTEENWNKLPDYMVSAFEYMSEHFGKYPYEQYSFIQGGDGGMEYPMATMITGERSLNSLVGVGVHELIHSWYQGVLATNESLYPWMDEGFTTYASDIVMKHLLDPQSDRDPHSGTYGNYFYQALSGEEEPLTTHADHYKTNRSYGINSYSKGSVFLHQLSYVIGQENLMNGLKRYFNTFKMKHPTAQDLIRVMEKESGMVLDWYLEHFVNTTNQIDYGIQSVIEKEGATYITIERYKDMMMPIDLLVEKTDGTAEMHYIPLRIMRGTKPVEYEQFQRKTHEEWPWVYPTYTVKLNIPADQIKIVVIDPSNRMADVNRDNNITNMDVNLRQFEDPTK
ncbi:MAG: M1 family metallopeptidase [Candidatus Cyclobacteriaceae bacterium M2_1C_046]